MAPPQSHYTADHSVHDDPSTKTDDELESDENDWQDESEEEMDVQETSGPSKTRTKRKPRKGPTQDVPFLAFIDRIDDIVNELLRLEGPGTLSSNPLCSATGCKVSLEPGSGYRCADCGPQASLFCKSCLVQLHKHRPFDRPEVWTGTHFARATFKSLGLRIQLGHIGDVTCPCPMTAYDDSFVVIHSNGVHEIGLDFCSCPGATDHVSQLLRARLFPATVDKPKTAATFSVLKLLQMLTFTAKISCQEFTQAMDRITGNTGVDQFPKRYRSMLRMLRVWRHTRLMKRFARGHDPGGWRATESGACAVICPACPHPNINLPANWKECRDKEAFLYWLFMALDANFRLKRKNVSSDVRDPGLIQGFCYILKDGPFREYLLKYAEKIVQDKSTCNDHDAIKSSSIRGGKGYAASGMGIGQYINMDRFFLSTAEHDRLKRLIVSYDIACQWRVKLQERCQQYEANILTSESPPEITFLVPKFHLPAHVEDCRTKFSFNYTPGVGRTDGEAPERGWAASNDLAYSTREMGPGSRRDTLDDCFGDSNWQKVTNLATSLHEKGLEAIQQRANQIAAFQEFDSALPENLTKSWTAIVQKWESNPRSRNPYKAEAKSQITYNSIRLALAEEDKAALGRGEDIPVHSDVTASMFILQGLEIEESQRKYTAWIALQDLYMPGIASYRKSQVEEGAASETVQRLPLYLPSDIIALLPIPARLARYEFRFRLAQADTALTELRAHLILRSQMYHSKKIFTHGTHAITRSHSLLQDVEKKIRNDAALYIAVRKRLLTLGGFLQDSSWEAMFLPLEQSDIRGMTADDDAGKDRKKDKETGMGDGRRSMTWIWRTGDIGDSLDDASETVLRIEWCKSRARAHRWQEECHLLAEEMRRTAVFLKSEENGWVKRAEAAASTSISLTVESAPRDTLPVLERLALDEKTILLQGKVAYAHKQADIRRRMAAHAQAKLDSIVDKLVPPGSSFELVELH
ncbi:hypothetical protein DFP72DRAFT_986476 [Ephemerocybe angulata]|uniref:CxC2-like cysteine cluster KDZ transposase-associated domain-containing protein n=1 Tax=Ephemerocybe angulata TaxID=980116 RepID=A0A8H6MCK5_9AGAR|nr:hypothetical protein DFP72DRAFT_986476 [Tulosesus angulatus]